MVRYVVIGLLVAIVCAFAGVVRGDFIDLDDRQHVIVNPLVRDGLSWDAAKAAFTHPHASLWVPLTWISLAADVSLFGMNPGAMHAVNLALHAIAAVLLFLALRRMTGRLWESAAVAALFGLHPINVESVAWITERKNVLCAVFWMLTMWMYAGHAARPRLGGYLAVAASLALAILSKPMAVTLPFALLLLDFWPLRRYARLPWRRLVLEKVPLLVLTAFAVWMQMRALDARGQTVSLETLPAAVRVSNALTSCAIYLGDLVWPARLGIFYPHPLKVQILGAMLAAVAIGAALFTAWRQRGPRPWLLVGLCWFLGTLVPMIGLVQAGSQARADRFTYIAQIGVFVIVAWTLAAVRRKRWLEVGASVALGALAFATARQVGFWSDSRTLFEHTLRVTPPNARVEALAGNACAANGDYAGAIPHYQKALRILPDIAETWNELGAALTRIHHDADAATAFSAALSYDPSLTTAGYNLGSTLARLGRNDEAIAQFERVLTVMPDFGRAHYHLGRLLAETGRRDEAREHLAAAARLLPGDLEIRGALAAMN